MYRGLFNCIYTNSAFRDVPFITRAVAILRLPGLAPSISLHFLRVLVAEELPKVDAAKQYGLSMGTFALPCTALPGCHVATLMQPGIDALSRRFAVTAIGVGVPRIDPMIVVALSQTQAPARDAGGVISRSLAPVGISSQLNRAAARALPREMRDAARRSCPAGLLQRLQQPRTQVRARHQ